MRRSLAPLFALALLGCADKTAILVEVTSTDLSVPADVDALRFVAISDAGHRLDEVYTLDGAWPESLTILPAGADDASITLTVTGTHAGAQRIQRVVHATFERGTTRHVSVVLSRDCLDVMCGQTVDCVSGMCVDATPLDGGVDAGSRDAGSRDAGSSDAGTHDGGARDAGTRDAGTHDAGSRDAGSPDAGPPDSGLPDAGPIDAGPPPILIFSEYVEGLSSNKAIEIANIGATPADLADCTLRRYSNGTTTPFPISIGGTLAPGAVFVICNSSIDIATECDQLTASISHNGDDAYDLVCGGMVVDTFGRIGEDPGTEWMGGGLFTLDYVLTRRCSVTTGDVDGSDAFDPSVEWQGAAWMETDAAASLAGLGNRSECP